MGRWMAVAVVVRAGAALAQERPITLPQGAVEGTLLGNYTNWGGEAVGGGQSVSGESAAFAIDYGFSPTLSMGLAIALPVNPGFNFGSAIADLSFALGPHTAVRADFGTERIGANGANTNSSDHVTRYFAGAGPYVRVPLSQNIDFVWGRSGAARFARFLNLQEDPSSSSVGLYFGGSYFPSALAADALMVSSGSDKSGTVVAVNLPFGLTMRPDPVIALTLQAGFSTIVLFPDSGSSQTVADHFLPLGFEAVVSPAPSVDLGLNFTLDGYLGQSGGSGSGHGPGFFDLRTVLVWVGFRG